MSPPVRLSQTRAVLALALLSAAALGSALLSQHVGGLAPCVLCLYQRPPHLIAILLAGASLAVRGGLRRTLIALAGLAWLTGAGIAAFHVGVEQHWWQGMAACGGTIAKATTLEALQAQILAAPVVRCDEVPWSLFGISMAGQNLALSLFLSVTALFLAVRPINGRPS